MLKRLRFGATVGVAGLSSGLFVLGGLVPASAATSATALPDFVNNRVANFAADVVSEDLQPTLAKSANFVGQRVTAAGLEVDLSSAPTLAETGLVSAEATAQAVSLSKFGVDPTSITVPVSIRTVPNSLASLSSLTSQLDSDAASWANKGIALSSWGPDLNSDLVVVHLQAYSTTAAQQLESTYGPLLSVASDSQSASGSSRTADVAPWWGGDKIDQGSTFCTSWFSVISASGAAVTPTAGHCGAGAWTQNGSAFGTVSSRHFGGTMDGELIPVSSNSPDVWSDPTSTNRLVTSLASGNTVGVLTCTDGVTDRERCSVRIDATGQSVSYDGQTITGTVSAHQTGDLNAFSAGDSGGPVETTSGASQSIAQGMVLARETSDAAYGWYMPARTVDSYFNVFVKTG